MSGVIRQYLPSDLSAVAPMIKAGFAALGSTISKFLSDASALVYEDDSVKGLAAVSPPRDDHGKRAVRVRLYTHPEYRRQGIGNQLWHAMTGLVRESGAELATTSYRCDTGDAPTFFTSRGFRPWFRLHDLVYTGPAFIEPQLTSLHYEDRFFADYLTMINDGFTDMRRTNNIDPNVIFGPDSFNDDNLRKEMLENRENLYVFVDGDEMIGLAELEAGADANAVDTIAVKPSHRGHGYGRAITQFCINRMRERGVHKVYIDVVGTNTVAQRLYESLGCTLEQSLEQARLWL